MSKCEENLGKHSDTEQIKTGLNFAKDWGKYHIPFGIIFD